MDMLVSHWSANPVVLAACAVAAGAHLAGTVSLARAAHASGRRGPSVRLAIGGPLV